MTTVHGQNMETREQMLNKLMVQKDLVAAEDELSLAETRLRKAESEAARLRALVSSLSRKLDRLEQE